jgi:lysine-N-methylase
LSVAPVPRRIKLPSHVLNFRCAQCGQCCTNKWRIDVDPVSYNILYKKLEELGREKELQENMLIDKTVPRIRFLENGKCPYLSDNNLCSLQLEIGEKYLLDICKTFPRNIFSSQDSLEFSLFLTCKTAIETLLHGPIRIIDAAWPIEDKEALPFSFIEPNATKKYDPDKLLLADSGLPYHELERLFSELVQDQNYSLSQRLVALGQLLNRLISENACQGGENAAEILASVRRDDHSLYIEPDLKRHLDHLYRMSNLLLGKFPLLAASGLLRNILQVLSSGDPCQNESDSVTPCSKVEPPPPGEYRQLLQRCYQSARGIVEPIVENYMVNFILGKNFYLRPLHFAYYRMAFAYAAIVAFCVGNSLLTGRPIDQEMVLQAIYDIEDIYYYNWFYPNASFLQAGKDHGLIIENGIALANI